MRLPKFETQGSLFESLGSLAGELFSDQDKYKLFATKIWPLLAKSREELAACYVEDNGRPGVEPVVLLGDAHLSVSGAGTRPVGSRTS